MIAVQRTIEVDRPVSAVFGYLADFTHTEQWDPGTVTTTRIDSGPLEVGARFHNVSQFRGRQTELQYRITTFEPDARLVFIGENKTVQSTDDLSFRATANGTAVTYRAVFRFKGLARIAEPLLRKSFEPIADDTAAQLKATLSSVL